MNPVTVLITILACSIGAVVLAVRHVLSVRSVGNWSSKILFHVGSMFLRFNAFFLEKTIFTIDYGGGFNLNFECTREEIKKVLPKHLEPVPMKILEGDNAKYLFSLYCADLNMKGAPIDLGRADAFTYVRDKDNMLSLCFVSAFIQYPRGNKMLKSLITNMNKFFGMDPYDYSLGYPHYDAEKIHISDNEFIMQVEGARIRVSGEENIQSKGNLFHRDFLSANSQIYRGANGAKNVNFFNQDFMNASVTSWDPATVVCSGDMNEIHALCSKKLVSVQHYQNAGGIRWYFENR